MQLLNTFKVNFEKLTVFIGLIFSFNKCFKVFKTLNHKFVLWERRIVDYRCCRLWITIMTIRYILLYDFIKIFWRRGGSRLFNACFGNRRGHLPSKFIRQRQHGRFNYFFNLYFFYLFVIFLNYEWICLLKNLLWNTLARVCFWPIHTSFTTTKSLYITVPTRQRHC